MTRPQSLFDVWVLYQEAIRATQLEQQANATLAQTQTALVRHVLLGLGFPVPKRRKLTNLEIVAALSFGKQVSLEQFSKARYIQQEVFEELEVPSNSQRNYRAALNKMLTWCEQQSWWDTVVTSEQQLTLPGKQKRSTVDIQITNRTYKDEQGKPLQEYKYGLGAVSGDEIPQKLLSELDAFKRFRTNPDGSNLKQVVKESTLDKDLKHIRLILGWLYRIRGIPLAELSFKQIVLLVFLKPGEDQESVRAKAQVAAQQVFELANDYIKWLKASPKAERPEARGRGIESTHTEDSVLDTFLLVAEFIYRQENESNQRVRAKNITVVKLLRQQISAAKGLTESSSCVSAQSKKILEWSEFLAFVERLRQECHPRLVGKGSSSEINISVDYTRTLPAIAYSYQCFLLAALMSYIPPQRQQIYRNLRIPYPGASPQKFLINSNNQGKQKDEENLNTGLLLFPEVRTTEVHHKDYPLAPAGVSGYLYKEASLWYIHLFPDEYKTGKNYEELSIKVPNIQYPDGRYFYQYLEEWLFEYTYQNKKGVVKNLKGLRQVFNPQHEYLFTQKEGKRYTHPTNFSNLLRVPAYMITGKVVAPDSLRKMFTKHFSSIESKLITPDNLKKKDQVWDENYDVWLKIGSIDLSKKLAEEFAQDFVKNYYRSGNFK